MSVHFTRAKRGSASGSAVVRIARRRLAVVIGVVCAGPSLVLAQTYTVSSTVDLMEPGSLRAAIAAANAYSGPATINFAGSPQTFVAGEDLPPIINRFGVTINGNGWTLFGTSIGNDSGSRGLFFGVGNGEAFSGLQATTSTPYAINNLRLTNFRARGGNGGGGGAGLGGAIFLNAGNLTLTGVTLGSNRAVGGNGGTQLGQGGGGMGGNGGVTYLGHGGGGGGFGPFSNGGERSPDNTFQYGAPGNFFGGADGGTGGRTASIELHPPGLGGVNGGGGGYGGYSFTSSGTRNWYGGGGGGGVNGGTGGSELATIGGVGGFGGGGGGGGVLDGSLPSNVLSTGGQGGFGGGGGAAGAITLAYANPGNGGNGGFGGGGGPSNTISFFPPVQRGLGGFGAGSGTGPGAATPQGGGGLGAGGSIFIRQGASLTINDGTWLGGDVVAGGAGGVGANNGQGIGAAIFLAGSLNYSVSAANTVVFPQDLGGGSNAQITGGLTKSGPGTFVLASSVQTFTGGITVSGGTLQIGNGGTAADLRFAGNIVNNATLAFEHSNSLLISNRISGTGALIKNGTSTLTLTGFPNSYTGATVVNAGTLGFGSASAIATGSAYTVNGGTVLLTAFDATLGALAGSGGTVSIGTRTLTVGDARSTIAAATLTGTTGRLVKQGTGTLTLSGSNNFGGGVTIREGTLALGFQANNALPTNGDVSIVGGTLDLASATATIGNLSFDRPATGNRTILYSGASSATLVLGGDITINGGNTPIYVNANVYLTPGQHVIDDPTGFAFELPSPPVFTGGFFGPGGLTMYGLFLTVALGGANNYTGPTIVGGGSLLLAATNTLPVTTALTVTDASVSLAPTANTNIVAGNYDQTIASLAGSGGTINLGSATLTVGDSTSTTFAGILTGTGGRLVKQGAGTLTLTEFNSHTGGVVVNGGTLLLFVNGKVGADGSPIAVNSGGTLDLGTRLVVAGQVNDPGAGVGTITNGTLNLNGNNLFFRSGTLDADLTGTGNSRIWLGGDTAGTLLLGGTNTVQFADNNSTIIGHPLTGAAGIVRLTSPTALGPANIGGSTIEAQLFTGTIDANGQGGITVGSLRLQSGASSKLINSNTSATASFTGTVTLVAAATDIGGPGTLRFDGPVVGAGGLNKTGPGTVILASSNTYAGGTTISGGTLRVGTGGTTGTLPSANLTNNGTLVFDRSNDLEFGPNISGTGALVKLGAGILTLTGSNGYSGGTTITAGTLQLGRAGGSGSGSILGPVVNNATLAFSRTGTLIVPGSISGPGTVRQIGTGTTVLAGASSYTGPTVISAGVLELNSGGFINSTSSITIGNASGAAATLRLTGVDRFGNGTVTSTVPVTVAATGTLASSGTYNTLVNVTLSGGTVLLNGGTFPDFPAFGLKGTLTVTGTQASQFITGTGVNNAVNIGPTNAPGALTFNVADVTASAAADLTVGAVLQNNALESGGINASGLTKTGPGTLVLSAANTYTGPTTITAGTLQIGGGGTTGSIGGIVNNNAAMVFSRSAGSVFPAVGAVTGSGTLTVSGGRATVGLVRLGGGVSVAAGQSLTVAAGSGLSAIGGLSLGAGATLDLTDNSLVVRNGDLAALRTAVATWWAGGAETGPGLGSSTARLATTGRDVWATLAVFPNDRGGGLPYFDSLSGVTLAGSDVLVKYTYRGDTDLDGDVDASDLVNALEGFSAGLTGWQNGDIDYDGAVTAADLGLLLAARAGQGSPFAWPAGEGPGAGAIPEPAGLGLLAAVAMPLVRRRRR